MYCLNLVSLQNSKWLTSNFNPYEKILIKLTFLMDTQNKCNALYEVGIKYILISKKK